MTTIRIEITSGQRAAYLYDWDHHSETDDMELRVLWECVAYSKVSTLTDETGKRRRRAVLELEPHMACDYLTYLEYAIDANESDARDGDSASKARIRHHRAAWDAARAAGAETIREYNKRTGAK